MKDFIFAVPKTIKEYKLLSSLYRCETSDLSRIGGFVIPREEAPKYDCHVIEIPDEYEDPKWFVCDYWDGDITFDDQFEKAELKRLIAMFNDAYRDE